VKAVVWHGKEDVRVEDVREPALRVPADAIVRGNSRILRPGSRIGGSVLV
jgi:hypothetical protein